MPQICIVTAVIVNGHVYYWKYHPSIHQHNIFTVSTRIRIYMSLKVYIFPTLKLIFFQAVLNIVVYQMLIVTNVPVNTAVYSMCYSVINPCRYWTSQTLSALASYRNTLYNVLRTKRHCPSIFLKVSLSHWTKKWIYQASQITANVQQIPHLHNFAREQRLILHQICYPQQ